MITNGIFNMKPNINSVHIVGVASTCLYKNTVVIPDKVIFIINNKELVHAIIVLFVLFISFVCFYIINNPLIILFFLVNRFQRLQM